MPHGCGCVGVRAGWRAACRPGWQPPGPRRPPSVPAASAAPAPGRSRGAGAGTRSMEHCCRQNHGNASPIPRPEKPRGCTGRGHLGCRWHLGPEIPGPRAHSGRATPMPHCAGWVVVTGVSSGEEVTRDSVISSGGTRWSAELGVGAGRAGLGGSGVSWVVAVRVRGL